MNESEIQVKDETPKPRIPKLSAEKALPQSSAEVLVKIIKGYAVASNGGETQINYKDVASAANLNPTVVSRNNSFLLESQILTSPKYGYYVPSEGAVRFARESAWDEAGAKSHLRKIVLACWYGQVLVQNLTLNPTLKREDLKRTLAIKCGATEGDANALEFLIDFLIYTGLIELNENGTLSKGNFDELIQPIPLLETKQVSIAPVVGEQKLPQQPPKQPVVEGASLVLHLHINSFDELTPEHAAKLKEWIDLLQRHSPDVRVELK
jgi:hypothetical protein